VRGVVKFRGTVVVLGCVKLVVDQLNRFNKGKIGTVLAYDNIIKKGGRL